MKRILLCSPAPLDRRIGLGKHWLELADSLRGIGWETDAVGPHDVAGGPIHATPETLPPLLREFLRRGADGYDVVEYDHSYLPYPRSDFPPGPLFVARCMLLNHHFLTTPIPPAPRFRSRLRHALTAGQRRRWLERLVSQDDATVHQADLTVVSNNRDAEILIRCGADPGRIAILPPGLTPGRRQQLAAAPVNVPDRPTVGFVGTFDPRKGMCEFPTLVDRVARRIPGVTFRLLGTAGMIPDAEGVRRYFPYRQQSRLEIHPRYDPDELPDLLTGVSIGVFPSRVESFGYGVLEMLAAAVPVIAYDAPGPHVMLPTEFRVPVGAVEELADRVCTLLSNPGRLRAARQWARVQAGEFNWERVAAETGRVYLERQAGRLGRTPA